MLKLVPDRAFRDLVIVTWETGCRPQESLREEARHVGIKEFGHTVHIWDVARQKQIVRYPLARGKRVYHLAYGSDSGWLSIATGQAIVLLKCSTSSETGPAVIPFKNVVALNVSGDELTALTRSGRCLRWTLGGAPALHDEFDLGADKHRWWFVHGDLAVSADESSTWRLWDLARRTVLHQYTSFFADSVDALNPDSHTFASGGIENLRICDLTTGEERLVLPRGGRVLRFRSDGRAVATEKRIWFASDKEVGIGDLGNGATPQGSESATILMRDDLHGRRLYLQ